MRFLVQIIEIHIHTNNGFNWQKFNQSWTNWNFVQINGVQIKHDCIIFYCQQRMYFATYLDRKGFKTLITKWINQYLIYPNFQKFLPLSIFLFFFIQNFNNSSPKISLKISKKISNISKNLDFHLEDLQYKKTEITHTCERENVKAKVKEQQWESYRIENRSRRQTSGQGRPAVHGTSARKREKDNERAREKEDTTTDCTDRR